MGNKHRTGRRLLVGLLLAAALVGSLVGIVPDRHRAQATSPSPAAAPGVELRPLSTSADLQIVDDQGRQVLLRGANVNSLGRYWQGVPSLPTTLPVTDADWDTMAAHGFSVIRLIISWSRVEPTRGFFDASYLDEVASYVDAAAAHGIYTVIDMHQDAYTDSISTTDPASCPAGTRPAKGWDGAPAWATITDGASSCLAGSDRNSSPAVTRAWNHFWDDTDGIRTEFTKAWAHVAARFAGRRAVAGYDLLNEPEVSRPASELTPLYDDLIRETVTAIRDAEHDAGATFDHIIFVEPGLPAADPSQGLMIPDPGDIGLGTADIVAAPHNYAESIDNGVLNVTIEQMSDLFDSIASSLGLPVWIGEYGFWDTSDATLAKIRRYAANEDAKAQGGAWWQWRQSCGDPHSVRWDGDSVVAPGGVTTHLNLLGCPGNTDLGPNDAFLDVLGRAYPRATPGRITHLASDPDTGAFTMAATAGPADVSHQLVVWTPTAADAQHQISTSGLGDVTTTTVPGGRIITATVDAAGDYTLRIGPRAATTTTAPPTSHATTTTSVPATTGPSTTRGNPGTVVATSTTTTSVAGSPGATTPPSTATPAAPAASPIRQVPAYTG